MTRRLLAAALFGIKRFLQFFGFFGGAHRARQEPHVRLVLATAGLVATCGIATYAVLHLAAFKEIPR